jgi:transposase
MGLPRFLRQGFEGYEVIECKEYLKQPDGSIEIWLRPKDEEKPLVCHRCKGPMHVSRGKYPVRLEGMPIMSFRFVIHLWRRKGHCSHCKKARAEHVEFIAQETPHLTQEYAWWIGRMCEIAAVSRVAELMNQDETTTWRLDLARMQRMLSHYRIPKVRKLSVDEVYARKKAKYPGENRDQRFFTVISDLETRRVIWVSESRSKEALDQFFLLIGKQASAQIEVVAGDLYEGYQASVKESCPQAVFVWDRFHVMQIFEEAVNETRISLHDEQERGSDLHRLSRGKYRFMFVKKALRRTEVEKRHIDDVLKENERFAKLELIKERMLTFFDQPDEVSAKTVFDEVGEWIWQAGFTPLMKWHKNLEGGWSTLKNYFRYRVSSSLSEGHNNVIKMLKRRAFGYRNMEYFRLKIMQVCGYLNSRYIPHAGLL